MYILGIDPGTSTIGYALVQKSAGSIELVDYGVLHTAPKIDQTQKLLEIAEDITQLLEKYSPQRVGIEKLYFNTNITTGIAVAEARGVISYICIKKGIEILEYTPLQVKKAITGNGQAKKLQLQRAIQMLFGLSDIPKPDDAADAIGIAYMSALRN